MNEDTSLQGRYAQAVELRILLSMIGRIATIDLERRLASYGYASALQHTVMRLLDQHGHTISELSRQLMLEPATLVPVIDALERDGLVERSRDPRDRRRTPIQLTPRGDDLLARVPVVDDADTLVCSLAAMGGEKSSQLLSLLRELAALVAHDEHAVAEISATVQDHFTNRPKPIQPTQPIQTDTDRGERKA